MSIQTKRLNPLEERTASTTTASGFWASITRTVIPLVVGAIIAFFAPNGPLPPRFDIA